MHLRDGVSAKSQPRKMQCQPMIYSVFEEGGRASRNAYKPMDFQSFWYLFGKVASKSFRNNRFYKGLRTAILGLRGPCFYQGIARFFSTRESPQGMLINIMLFQ